MSFEKDLVRGFEDGDFILSIDLCLNFLPDLRFVLEQNPEMNIPLCYYDYKIKPQKLCQQTQKLHTKQRGPCFTCGSEIKTCKR